MLAPLGDIHHLIPELPGGGSAPFAHFLTDQFGADGVNYHSAVLVDDKQVVVAIKAGVGQQFTRLLLGLFHRQGAGQKLDLAHGLVQHGIEPCLSLAHQISLERIGRDEQQRDKTDKRQREQQDQFAAHGDITELEHD